MRFTDERLYVLGIGTGYMTDLKTGDFLYWSDKMQEANVSVSASDNELRAGLGNGPAIIVPTDPNITVTVTAAEYSEYVKAASVGAAITQGAPVMVCREVTAEGPNLAVDLSGGTPVAGLGMDKAVCYVQEVGEESRVYIGGTAYKLEASTGAVEGFTAESGKRYAVSYFTTQANATLTTVTSNIRGKVVRFVFSQPVYTGCDPTMNIGDFWGWLHTVVPRLQLMPSGGGTDGSQTAFTVTGFTGRAVAQDAAVITEECGDCGFTGLPMMYRILEPCGGAGSVDGISGIIGGNVALAVGESIQLHPAVIKNGVLNYSLPPSDFQYSSSDTDVATVGYNSGALIGSGAGTARIAVFYTAPETGERFTDILKAVINGSGIINDTRLYLSVAAGRTITLCYTQSAANAVLIDWGDGSEKESSTSLNAKVTHTYINGGTPVLSMHVQSAGKIWNAGVTENGTPVNILGAAPGAYVSGITSISFGTGARLSNTGGFRGITSLTGLVFTESDMNVIGEASFKNCTSLSVVDLGGITEIDQGAFESCYGLAGLSIPASVETVRSYAFKSSGLVNLLLAAENIEGEAFAECTRLQNVWIRDSVSNLGNDAGIMTNYPWNGCGGNTVLYCEESNKPGTWGYEYNVHGFSNGARTRLITVWGQTESPFQPAWGETHTGSLAYTWDYETLTIELSVQNYEDEYQSFSFSDVLMTLDVQDISTDYYVGFYDDIGSFIYGENVEPGQSVTSVPGEYSEWTNSEGGTYSSEEILNMAVESDINWFGVISGE